MTSRGAGTPFRLKRFDGRYTDSGTLVILEGENRKGRRDIGVGRVCGAVGRAGPTGAVFPPVVIRYVVIRYKECGGMELAKR